MDIKLLDYKNADQRILSTESVLCFTCVNICLKSAVKLTSKFDMVRAEHMRYR